MKDPLAQAGKDVLVHAAEFALEKGVTMALDSLAAGKRAVPYIYTVFLFFLSKYACTFPKETLFLSTDLIVLFLAKITQHPIRLLHSRTCQWYKKLWFLLTRPKFRNQKCTLLDVQCIVGTH